MLLLWPVITWPVSLPQPPNSRDQFYLHTGKTHVTSSTYSTGKTYCTTRDRYFTTTGNHTCLILQFTIWIQIFMLHVYHMDHIYLQITLFNCDNNTVITYDYTITYEYTRSIELDYQGFSLSWANLYSVMDYINGR